MSPDVIPYKNSDRLITSGGVYEVIKDKVSASFVWETFTSIETFETEMPKKQDKFLGYEGQYVGFRGMEGSDAEVMTPDWLPQKDSDYLITSGGVYDAIGDIETALDNIIVVQNNLIGGGNA